MRNLWSAGAAVGALCLWAAGGVLGQAGAQPDLIKLKSGTEVKGKIVRLTSQSVNYTDTGGKSQSIKKDDVESITFSDAPLGLSKARQAIAESKWDKVPVMFQQALDEITQNKSRSLHKEYIFYEWAVGLRTKGDKNEALSMLKRLRAECGDCWLRMDSYRLSIDIARTLGDASHEAVLAEMKGEPEPIGGEAEMEIGRMKFGAKEYDAANQIFTRLAANNTAPYAPEARLYNLRCLREQKKMDELEATCTKILSSDRALVSPALIQSAGASLADIHLKKAEKDKSKLRDVLMTAIQAIAIGPVQGKEEGIDYALALVTAAKCYVLLSDGLEKAESKDDYKHRAINYYLEVTRFFPNTPLAQVSQKELVALGVEEHKKEAPKEAPKDPKTGK
jgi:hypothetical protein